MQMQVRSLIQRLALKTRSAVVVVADAIAIVREATVLVVTAAKLESVGLVAVISGVYVVVVVVSCSIGEAHSSLQDFGTVLGNAEEQERALWSWEGLSASVTTNEKYALFQIDESRRSSCSR